MKFIKYAVGLVIALSVIPMVVVAVTKLDEPRLKTVTFEVVDWDSGTNEITFSENTYNNIHSLAILDVGNPMNASNVITVKLNGIELIEPDLEFYNANDAYDFYEAGGNEWEELNVSNQATSTGYPTTIGDKWEMTFEVPSQVSPLIKTLIGFAPLLFIGGVLLFMLNKRKLA